jgi:hypothetical protein
MLDRDCLHWAGVDASSAIAASIGVNHGNAVLHGYRAERARFDTGFTSGAFFLVHNGCHQKYSQKSLISRTLFNDTTTASGNEIIMQFFFAPRGLSRKRAILGGD